MDMLCYKEMWRQAEREGGQETFLRRLYEALEEGQEWLSLMTVISGPQTRIDMQSKRLQTIS
jgi:hypothetical protein